MRPVACGIHGPPPAPMPRRSSLGSDARYWAPDVILGEADDESNNIAQEEFNCLKSRKLSMGKSKPLYTRDRVVTALLIEI